MKKKEIEAIKAKIEPEEIVSNPEVQETTTDVAISTDETDAVLTLERIEYDKLPRVVKSFEFLDAHDFKGVNNVDDLLYNFAVFMEISKRVKSQNTKNCYLWNCKQWLLWCNQTKVKSAEFTTKIEDITTPQLLQSMVIKYNNVLDREISEGNLKKNSVALKMNSIRKFFVWRNILLIGNNLPSINIIEAFNPDYATTQDTNAFKRQTRINKDVFEAIKAVVNQNDMSEKWIFFFLAHGCRRSEISIVRNEDVDFLNKCINVWQPKTSDNKKLPMPDWLVDKSQLESEHTFLITNESRRTSKSKGIKPVSTQYIYNIIQKWISKTEFKDIRITPHSFRRYFINMLQTKGASDTNIMKLSGHKTPSMVARYGYDLDTENNPIVVNKMIDY